MQTRVVHWKKEPYTLLITRGDSLFGNPFRIGEDGNRSQVISKHKEWLEAWLLHKNEIILTKDNINYSNKLVCEQLYTIDNQTLGCWCHPQPCHGDTLIEMRKLQIKMQLFDL